MEIHQSTNSTANIRLFFELCKERIDFLCYSILNTSVSILCKLLINASEDM